LWKKKGGPIVRVEEGAPRCYVTQMAGDHVTGVGRMLKERFPQKAEN